MKPVADDAAAAVNVTVTVFVSHIHIRRRFVYIYQEALFVIMWFALRSPTPHNYNF